MAGLNVKFADPAPRRRCKLLCGRVVPRPIALVSSLSPAGVVNAAPYSFFSASSREPGIDRARVAAQRGRQPQGHDAHHPASGEFVVNLVDEGSPRP